MTRIRCGTLSVMALSHDQRASLRKWATGHSPHVLAAVDLLDEHGTWFRRQDFTGQCVDSDDDGITWINWTKAREAYEAGLRGSSTELAVLDFAIALGQDRYRFSQMGNANSRSLVEAVTAALG